MAKTKTANNNQKSFFKQPIFIGLVAILGIALVSGVIIWLTVGKSEEAPVVEVTKDEQKPEEKELVPEKKDPVKPEVPQYEGESPNELEALTGRITIMSNADGFLTVAAMLDQLLSEEGTCTMTLTGRNTGQVYTVSAPTEREPSNSVCGILKIATSNMASDYYDVQIELKGDNKKGLITEGIQI